MVTEIPDQKYTKYYSNYGRHGDYFCFFLSFFIATTSMFVLCYWFILEDRRRLLFLFFFLFNWSVPLHILNYIAPSLHFFYLSSSAHSLHILHYVGSFIWHSFYIYDYLILYILFSLSRFHHLVLYVSSLYHYSQIMRQDGFIDDLFFIVQLWAAISSTLRLLEM